MLLGNAGEAFSEISSILSAAIFRKTKPVQKLVRKLILVSACVAPAAKPGPKPSTQRGPCPARSRPCPALPPGPELCLLLRAPLGWESTAVSRKGTAESGHSLKMLPACSHPVKQRMDYIYIHHCVPCRDQSICEKRLQFTADSRMWDCIALLYFFSHTFSRIPVWVGNFINY